jgi:hypothetical protein
MCEKLTQNAGFFEWWEAWKAIEFQAVVLRTVRTL